MNKEFCKDKVKEYILSSGLNICLEDFEKNGVVIKKNDFENTVKIIGVENATIISVSKDLYLTYKNYFKDKCRDICFELPYTYGGTILYIPNFKNEEKIKCDSLKVETIAGKENIKKCKFPKSFENCITHDDNGVLQTEIIIAIFDGEKIVSCAGAMKVYDGIYEMGIDTLPRYRKKGYALFLSNNLKLKFESMNIVPIWRASVTNIGS